MIPIIIPMSSGGGPLSLLGLAIAIVVCQWVFVTFLFLAEDLGRWRFLANMIPFAFVVELLIAVVLKFQEAP